MRPLLLNFKFPEINNVNIYFSTRVNGKNNNFNLSLEIESTEEVSHNRQLIKKIFNIKQWIELKQVHKDNIYITKEKDDFFYGPTIQADGVFTHYKNTALIIKTADCQPIFFTNLKGEFIAAVHCGWRGNALDFPSKAVSLFSKHYNLTPEEILVVRGPSLGPCCAEFKNYQEYWPDKFWKYFNKQEKIDLWHLTENQLITSGVPKKNIFSIDLCTKCNKDIFYSYRRNKDCGRMINFIILR